MEKDDLLKLLEKAEQVKAELRKRIEEYEKTHPKEDNDPKKTTE